MPSGYLEISPSLLLRAAVKLPVRLAERLFATLLFAVSLVVPRSSRIWVFGSWYGVRFADNTKHFYLYCSTLENPPIKAIWLSRNRSVIAHVRGLGLRAHHTLTPIGIWYRLRAGVYLIDSRIMDIGSIGARGATIVNLWHGVPLKKIERDIEQADHPIVQARAGSAFMRFANRLFRPQFTEKYDFVLATSAVTAARFASAFGVTPDRVLTAGYPRNDCLLTSTSAPGGRTMSAETALIEEWHSHARAGRRVLLYMPTFRDWNNFRTRPIPIDWLALDEVLQSNAGVLYCKLHPGDRVRLPDLNGLRHIRMIPTEVDIYPALRYTDALVTDYSSIFFDYLLLDKPILFYPYDLEEYQQMSRTLYDPYEEVTPGPKAYTSEEFQKELTCLLQDYSRVTSRWRAERTDVRAMAHEFMDGRASERLLEVLLERTHSSPSPG